LRVSQDGRAGRPGRPLAGAAVAFAGILAFWAYAIWSAQNDAPRPFQGTAAVLVVIALWLLIGLVAGLISKRMRDALVTWAASIAALTLAVLVANVVEPDRLTGDMPVEASVAFTAIAMLPPVAGGHVFGAWAARRSRRQA